jgi:hypothetical protein
LGSCCAKVLPVPAISAAAATASNNLFLLIQTSMCPPHPASTRAVLQGSGRR